MIEIFGEGYKKNIKNVNGNTMDFLVSLIDFKVTTKWVFWGVFKGIYYNPYYHAGRRIRPSRKAGSLTWRTKRKDRF